MTATPARRTAVSRWQRIGAQARMELRLLLRNGENLLVTLGLPLAVLLFFTLVPVLPGRGRSISFLVPAALTLAVMGSAMVSLGIATGFERAYLVLKRLGATPLRRSELLVAKAFAVLAIEGVQVVLIVATGLALGWRPNTTPLAVAGAAVALALGSVAFAGIGLALAGRLPALGALAAINAVFLALLLIGGVVVPLHTLPDALRAIAVTLPSAWLALVLHASLDGGTMPVLGLAVLAAWAVAAAALAARLFRWE